MEKRQYIEFCLHRSLSLSLSLSLYKGYMVLKFLQEVTWAHKGLHGLLEVTNVTRGYRGLQRVTRDYTQAD